MKKLMTAIVLCVLVFWTGRIYSINRKPQMVTYYSIGDIIDCGDLELSFVESHLDNPEEFEKRFAIDGFSNIDGDFKMISICIDVTNKSDNDIGWEEVFEFIECGFESPVWASSIDPMVGAQVNVFQSETLKQGATQSIWFLTEVNKSNFRAKSWDTVDDYQYVYVLTLVPQKIAVRLVV